MLLAQQLKIFRADRAPQKGYLPSLIIYVIFPLSAEAGEFQYIRQRIPESRLPPVRDSKRACGVCACEFYIQLHAAAGCVPAEIPAFSFYPV